jgi:hypothetical protein
MSRGQRMPPPHAMWTLVMDPLHEDTFSPSTVGPRGDGYGCPCGEWAQ